MGGPPNHFGTKISEGTPQEPLQPKFPLHRSERPHFALFWFTYWELDPVCAVYCRTALRLYVICMYAFASRMCALPHNTCTPSEPDPSAIASHALSKLLCSLTPATSHYQSKSPPSQISSSDLYLPSFEPCALARIGTPRSKRCSVLALGTTQIFA